MVHFLGAEVGLQYILGPGFRKEVQGKLSAKCRLQETAGHTGVIEPLFVVFALVVFFCASLDPAESGPWVCFLELGRGIFEHRRLSGIYIVHQQTSVRLGGLVRHQEVLGEKYNNIFQKEKTNDK